jgi:hypothetical protein
MTLRWPGSPLPHRMSRQRSSIPILSS